MESHHLHLPRTRRVVRAVRLRARQVPALLPRAPTRTHGNEDDLLAIKDTLLRMAAVRVPLDMGMTEGGGIGDGTKQNAYICFYNKPNLIVLFQFFCFGENYL